MAQPKLPRGVPQPDLHLSVSRPPLQVREFIAFRLGPGRAGERAYKDVFLLRSNIEKEAEELYEASTISGQAGADCVGGVLTLSLQQIDEEHAQRHRGENEGSAHEEIENRAKHHESDCKPNEKPPDVPREPGNVNDRPHQTRQGTSQATPQ